MISNLEVPKEAVLLGRKVELGFMEVGAVVYKVVLLSFSLSLFG